MVSKNDHLDRNVAKVNKLILDPNSDLIDESQNVNDCAIVSMPTSRKKYKNVHPQLLVALSYLSPIQCRKSVKK